MSTHEIPPPSPDSDITLPVVDCAGNPAAALKTMFVDVRQRGRMDKGEKPVQRAVFRKLHGVAGGTFTVRPDLPPDLRVGVFAQPGKTYPTWVRFSSDIDPAKPDLRSTCGIGIKLFGVDGPKLGPEPGARTHDFILQNHDVFFVDTDHDMCEFTQAGVLGPGYDSYLNTHPVTNRVIQDMKKVVPSVLGTPYWSGLPYAFGSAAHVKYKLVPVSPVAAEPANDLSTGDPDYLRPDLRARLRHSAATFHFLVQFQLDPRSMPVDAATVRWSESASPPVHVATLTLPRQDVDAEGQVEYGENLAFDTWHALAEHAPEGSIARARQKVYPASAELRREANHVPREEPVEPRPIVDPSMVDTTVVRAAIHPSIGIARVGNSESEDGFLLGPETIRPDPLPAGEAKDPTGALKRQAARFRVYGYNAAGAAVAELTAENAEIEWTVHVANQKAAWYEFQIALDIPEARNYVDHSVLRNKKVTGDDRKQLVIDPGPRTIGGRDVSGERHRFDTGTFFDHPVYLGELRTDEAGRLLFLGGRGHADSRGEKTARGFANNDDWYDDTADGPVTATVTIDGRPVPVEPAWVVTAPPNYAPDLVGVRTLYDLLVDVNNDRPDILPVPENTLGVGPLPGGVSFTRDVLPILERMVGMGWVNRGFADRFGPRGRENFLDPVYLERLASGRDEDGELRNQIYTAFRDFDRDGPSPVPSPWIYGDAISLPPSGSPRQHSVLSRRQMHVLALWSAGNFVADLHPSALAPFALEDLPVGEQPGMLDQASLTFCLADAFHPGCELTWPMRQPSLYSAPFRVRHRPADQPEPSMGEELTPDTVAREDGPLFGQSAGTLTRWMAIPWHTDTASCRSGYYVGYGLVYDPYLPTFWAARVPNHVLREEEYEVVVNSSLLPEERAAAFEKRAVWLRWLTGNGEAQRNQMVDDWAKLGVVTTKPGPDDGKFGAALLVETDVGFSGGAPSQRNLQMLHVPGARDPENADAAIALAVEASDTDTEQVTVDYIHKLDGFRGQRIWQGP